MTLNLHILQFYTLEYRGWVLNSAAFKMILELLLLKLLHQFIVHLPQNTKLFLKSNSLKNVEKQERNQFKNSLYIIGIIRSKECLHQRMTLPNLIQWDCCFKKTSSILCCDVVSKRFIFCVFTPNANCNYNHYICFKIKVHS